MFLPEVCPQFFDEVHEDDLAGVVADRPHEEDAVVSEVVVDKLLEQNFFFPWVLITQDQEVFLDEVFSTFAGIKRKIFCYYFIYRFDQIIAK